VDVRFGAYSGLKSDIVALPKSANNGRDLCWIKMHMAPFG
jgi:hypothetical protein